MFGAGTRPNRMLAFLRAQMRVGDEWVEVGIANVSATGLMVKCTYAPEAGSRIEIRRRGVAIAGKVVWAMHSRFGVETDDVIDRAALFARSHLQADRRIAARDHAGRRGWPRWRC